MILLQVVVAFKTGCYEFWVVNQAILVTINHLHRAFQVWKVNFYFLAILQPIHKLLYCQLTVTVSVNLGEVLSQEDYLVFRNARGHVRKSCPLELDRIHIVLHIWKNLFVYMDLTELFIFLPLNPRVVVCLLGSEPHIRLPFQQLRNKIFRFLRNIVPDWVRKAVTSLQYTIDNLFVWPTSERRPST